MSSRFVRTIGIAFTAGRGKPPICPWRIEVGDPGTGVGTLFLHVLEITDEQIRQPSDVKLIPPSGVAIGDKWQVRFKASGPLGGKVGERNLSTTLKTEAQYAR